MKKTSIIILIIFLTILSGCSSKSEYEINGSINTNITNKNLNTSVSNINNDPWGGDQSIIEHEHKFVHTGNYFMFGKRYTNIGSGENVTWWFNTTSNPIHINQWNVRPSASPVIFDLYENCTINQTNKGTLLEEINKNRYYAHMDGNSTVELYQNPDILDNGKLLDPQSSEGDKKKAGSIESPEAGFHLRAHEDYCIIFTNLNGNDLSFHSQFEWHKFNDSVIPDDINTSKYYN